MSLWLFENLSLLQRLEDARFLDIKLLNALDFMTLLFRYFFNLFVVTIIVRFIYYPIRKDKEYLFTYFLFNTLIFFVCYVMASVKLELGFAFGLFALFSILRYRTTTLPVKEMTYLFAVITIAVINALSSGKFSYAELLFTNSAIVFLLLYLEKRFVPKQSSIMMVTYEKIENIRPGNKEILLADLKKRTGLNITEVEIGRVSFLNDTVRLKIYHDTSDQKYDPDVSDLVN